MKVTLSKVFDSKGKNEVLEVCYANELNVLFELLRFKDVAERTGNEPFVIDPNEGDKDSEASSKQQSRPARAGHTTQAVRQIHLSC